ncbi:PLASMODESMATA CALLOSE-BINDING PROTEIN 4-like isoform X2 [Andrographis paniculata]|uniref:PLASMODESMATA CALLOSE-BINDING PROTEIN 4-like isoform X2 n=1 Tax=Andrographis paniculata TaxID=175694 RepID=UPI0021E820FF|nr:PLASMODESMATA CALLOSE-BINDING PROTEIN 4-like isoform X2 [Andrographis paniculata]
MDAAAAASMVLFVSISIVSSSSAIAIAMLPSSSSSMKQQILQTKLLLHSSSRRGLASFVPTDFTLPPDTAGAGAGSIPIPPEAPAAFPSTTPSIPTPVTNPVTTPSTGTGIPGPPSTTTPGTGIPGTPPVTNPVPPPTPMTGGFPGTVPAVAPPVSTGGQGQGQSWCVAKNGVPETSIQVALDYACGIGGADCSAIQQGAACYNPNTLQNHASFAFNSYYQKHPGPMSCDFGGAAMITSANPSTGSCVFPTSSSSPTMAAPTPPTASSTQPATTMSPTTMTPPAAATDPTMAPPFGMAPPDSSSTGATPMSSGISPNILNASSPDMGGAPAGLGFGANATSTASAQPLTGCIITVISIVAGRIISAV